MNQNPMTEPMGTGGLVVHITTARGAIPLSGAKVIVRNYLPDGTEGKGDVILSRTTGEDGNTTLITLPAPPRQNSLAPQNGTTLLPYLPYQLEIRLEGYRDRTYLALPIFDGITAIQPVDLVPLPESGRENDQLSSEERFDETPPVEL